MNRYQQVPMFDEEPDQPGDGQSIPPPPLQSDTPLDQAVEVYLVDLRLDGASLHTIRAFRSDLNLLAQWADSETPIGTFATPDLNRFLHWMLTERDRPCSPKTYARRVTTLKNFFGYLYEQNALPNNPALAVIQHPVSSPLPDVLSESEIARTIFATERMRTFHEKPDARPQMLVMLLLQTGIKKGECMALRLNDVNRKDPEAPFLWVRYTNPRLRYKERKIGLSPAWLPLLDEYLHQRRPQERLFDCTARNLEYVLRDVAQMAGVPHSKLSFENLRWASALRDYLDGMDHEELRQKLGLSRISWRETSSKLEQLAEQMEG